MAKSRRNNSRSRDVSYIANSKLRSYSRSSAYKFPVLTTVEDLRRFQPTKVLYVPRKVNLSRARVRVRKKNVALSPSRSFRSVVTTFADAKKVIICVRRGVRKQVLHALKLSGKAGQRRPRRTPYSHISCRG
jgi:hypothetical protein